MFYLFNREMKKQFEDQARRISKLEVKVSSLEEYRTDCQREKNLANLAERGGWDVLIYDNGVRMETADILGGWSFSCGEYSQPSYEAIEYDLNEKGVKVVVDGMLFSSLDEYRAYLKYRCKGEW